MSMDHSSGGGGLTPAPSRAELLAWAAGIFEGEGHIRVRHVSVELKVGMTDRDVVERFRAVIGAGKLTIQRRKAPYKDLYSCSVSKRVDAQAVLTLFWPWLGERRRERAVEALEAMAKGETSRRGKHNLKEYSCVCGGCGESFVSRYRMTAFCSETCRLRTRRKRYADWRSGVRACRP